MKKSTLSILLLTICLFITSCTAPVEENNTEADTTATAEETLIFDKAEGEVTAIETAVLFKEPKLGSGFPASLKRVRLPELWQLIPMKDGLIFVTVMVITTLLVMLL